MAVLLAIAVGGVYVGAAVVVRHRAQAAADLAALAGASRLTKGRDAACAQAAALATAMDAHQTGCTIEGLDVAVAVEVHGAMQVVARAAARAGPSQDDDSRDTGR